MAKFIRNLVRIEGHRTLKAVAELEWDGITLRGLKLEYYEQGGWRISTPSRHMRGRWEQVFQIVDPLVQKRLCERMLAIYESRVAS